MVTPVESTVRKRSNVGFVDAPALVGRLELAPQRCLQLRGIPLHTAPHGGVVGSQAALFQELLHITRRKATGSRNVATHPFLYVLRSWSRLGLPLMAMLKPLIIMLRTVRTPALWPSMMARSWPSSYGIRGSPKMA